MVMVMATCLKTFNMKKLLLLALFIFSSTLSWANIYYIASDGGTGTQCTGLTDHALAGATGTACRLNSLYWVYPRSGGSTTRQSVGGDTVVLEGSDQAGTGTYRIGCQNSSNCQDSTINLGSGQQCDASQSFNCILSTIPSGTTGTHTKLIGCTTSGCGCTSALVSNNWVTTCTHPRPELWGAGAIYQVLDVQGSSYVDLQDLEVTDHATCGYGHPTLNCGNTGNHPTILDAKNGIAITNSSDISFKNLNIHGILNDGMTGGSVGNHTYDNVRIFGNGSAGIDYDSCNNNGTCGVGNGKSMTFKNGFAINNNGCVENASSIGNIAASGCYDQNNGGYGDGIGSTTGSGTWTFTDGEVLHNKSDGIDLGYINGTGFSGGSVTAKRIRSEGNTGQQLKTDNNVYLEDSYIIGNCAYFEGQTFTYAGGLNCRGSSTIKIGNTVNSGTATAKFYNNTITSNDDVMFDASDLAGAGNCVSSFTVDIRNNLLLGGQDYNGGDNAASFYIGAGTCTGKVTYSEDYNTCSTGFKSDLCSGTHDLHPIASSATYSGTINQGPTYYTSANYINELSLKATSTAIGAALNSISGEDSYGWGSQDRGITWDMGALDYAAASPVCGDGAITSPEACDDTNLSAGDGCSATCTIETGYSCSGTPSVCVPICGNGLVTGTEACDDSNTVSGDGCNSTCTAVESNWACVGAPSVCTYTPPAAGNGGARIQGNIIFQGKSWH